MISSYAAGELHGGTARAFLRRHGIDETSIDAVKISALPQKLQFLVSQVTNPRGETGAEPVLIKRAQVKTKDNNYILINALFD
jgi:hypothetical protein